MNLQLLFLFAIISVLLVTSLILRKQKDEKELANNYFQTNDAAEKEFENELTNSLNYRKKIKYHNDNRK